MKTLLIVLFALTARAGEITPVSTVISGTLDPLTIAVSGNVIIKRTTKASSLFINGRQVDAESQSRHKHFFFTTDDTHVVVNADGSDVIDADLPSLLKIKTTSRDVILLVSPSRARVAVDNSMTIGGRERWIHDSRVNGPADDQWFKKIHEVEITDPGSGLERFYNVTLDPYVPPKRYARATVGYCGSALAADAPAYCLSVEETWDNRLISGLVVNATGPRGAAGPVWAYAIGARIGYQAWRRDDAPVPFPILEFGVGADYVQGQTTTDEGGGFQLQREVYGSTAYGYLLSEPIVFGNVGIGGELRGGTAESSDIRNASAEIFLSIHWR